MFRTNSCDLAIFALSYCPWSSYIYVPHVYIKRKTKYVKWSNVQWYLLNGMSTSLGKNIIILIFNNKAKVYENINKAIVVDQKDSIKNMEMYYSSATNMISPLRLLNFPWKQ